MNLPSLQENTSNSFASTCSTSARSRLNGDSAPISTRISPWWRFSFCMRPTDSARISLVMRRFSSRMRPSVSPSTFERTDTG